MPGDESLGDPQAVDTATLLAPASYRPESVEAARLYTNIKARLFGIQDAPIRVGTLRPIGRLGSGGMGEVFLAHDDELDRPVALKLVHAKFGQDSRFGERLRREARALAKLAHPNVVHVYEVGEHEGRFFLAMEYVEGQTLGAWVREHAPGWRAVLDAYLAAGEGLVAAHAAGLTHRDFKPDNVLRGTDGRIRVADFGLARVDMSASSMPDIELSFESGEGPSTLDERLSATGAVLGTPRYMPLEQLRGGLVDARSDQFAFCVALYEGLWGRLPFGGKTLSARELSLAADRPAVPRRGAVPGWLWPIIRRGLACEPAQRWPDMRSLLDQLREAPLRRRTRRRISVASLGLSVALVGGWLGFAPSRDDPCADQRHALDDVWNPERRAAIEQAVGTGKLGSDNGTRVVEQIDRWSQRWIDARVGVCRAERAGPSSPVVATQLECLEQRRGELEALLEIFAEADDVTRERAQSSVHGMADARACEARSLAGVGIEPPSAERAGEVALVRRELARVEALLLSGHWTKALQGAERLLEQAQALGYQPVEAEIRFARARAQLELGLLQAAREELELSVDMAEANRHEHLAIEIWIVLARRLAVLTGDPALGHDALRRLRAKVAASRREGEYAGDLAFVEGRLALADDQPSQAEAPLRVAIAQFDELGRHLDRVKARHVLARALEQLGRSAEALEQFRQVRNEAEQIYGPNHPRVAGYTRDLGVALLEQDQVEAGRTELNRALATWAEVPELSQQDLIDGHLILAMFDYQEVQLERARANVRAAESIAQARTDADPTTSAAITAAFAVIDYRDGAYLQALQEFEQAAEQFEAAQGAGDPTSIQTWTGCGWAALLAGQPERARLAFARVPMESVTDDSDQGISVHLGLAVTSVLLGQPDGALRELEALPVELGPLFALERDWVRVVAGDPSEDELERLRLSGSALTDSERDEFTALLTLKPATRK